jgi:hypothetical protein
MCGDAGRITLCKCTPRVPIFFDIDAHDHPGAEEADASQEARQNTKALPASMCMVSACL